MQPHDPFSSITGFQQNCLVCSLLAGLLILALAAAGILLAYAALEVTWVIALPFFAAVLLLLARRLRRH